MLGTIPTCSECMPEYMPENRDALMLWPIVRGQVIATFGQVIDINHLALWEDIDRFGVGNPKQTFLKILKLFHHFQEMEADGD